MLKVLLFLLFTLSITGCAPFQPYTELSPSKYYIVKADDNIHSIAFAPRQEKAGRFAPTANLVTNKNVPQSSVLLAE